MSDEPDDRALVARVLRGDVEAYAGIVRRHQRAIWRVAAAMLRDDAATENLVQQCFVDAYQHLHTWRPNEPLDRWLKAIARNLVRMEARRTLRHTRLLERYGTALLAQLADDATADEHDARVMTAVARCREELAPTAAEALRRRYDEGQSLDDVAGALGRTVVATRQLLFRVRAQLRACIEARLSGA